MVPNTPIKKNTVDYLFEVDTEKKRKKKSNNSAAKFFHLVRG